jgi:glycyl-tRNA synthetase
MEDIVSLCKRRGIIFSSSKIYNGFTGFSKYAPLEYELKKNVKDAWWMHFVQCCKDVVGINSSIVYNRMSESSHRSEGREKSFNAALRSYVDGI